MTMEFVFDDTLRALCERGTEALPGYEMALSAACEAFPPPFGQAWYGEKYRRHASEPGWLAASLIANAEKEAEGSRKLWSLVARTSDAGIADAIRIHAIDESRHALVYVAMCELVFPGSLEGDVKVYAESLSPRYSPSDSPTPSDEKSSRYVVLDELIQMNIGEIRTRIHQLLMGPVITAYCEPERRERLLKVLASLLADETKHIEYTARLIDAAARGGDSDFVRSTAIRRMKDFGELTLVEVGEATFVGE
jgi:hypothetical protein